MSLGLCSMASGGQRLVNVKHRQKMRVWKVSQSKHSLAFCEGFRQTSCFGVSNFLVSLGHTGRKRVVLDHTLNTLQHVITKKVS